MNWSDNEDNNYKLNQPNRDLPNDDTSSGEEDNEYYNIIYKKPINNFIINESSKKNDNNKKNPNKQKNKYVPVIFTDNKSSDSLNGGVDVKTFFKSNTIQTTNNRKFNPRLPPPNKK